MITGVGDSGGLMSAAIASARQRHADMLSSMDSAKISLGGGSTQATSKAGFSASLSDGIRGLDQQVKKSDRLHFDVLQGKVDLHEVSAQLRESRLAFDFAMAVRNKFVEAYREIMRMNV